MSRGALPLDRRSKYGAKRTTVDGIAFHSKREATRYQELRLLEKAGEIKNLELQPRFSLEVFSLKLQTFQHVGAYIGDFKYTENGQWVIEDVKSEPTKTPLYRLKRKMVESQYGIEIREV